MRCNAEAVVRLRLRKARYGKPFALMARDLEMIAAYAELGEVERSLLSGVAAPIVISKCELQPVSTGWRNDRENRPSPCPSSHARGDAVFPLRVFSGPFCMGRGSG